MKTRKLVIIAVFVLLMIATAVFWAVSFSNLIAENKAEVERTGIEKGINYFGFKILVAALTVVFEADVLYDVLYFISDKSKKTKQKNCFQHNLLRFVRFVFNYCDCGLLGTRIHQ